MAKICLLFVYWYRDWSRGRIIQPQFWTFTVCFKFYKQDTRLQNSFCRRTLNCNPNLPKMFLSGFQMVFDKLMAICPDFKQLGFLISDSNGNQDLLQPNLFSSILNPDQSGFPSTIVLFCPSTRLKYPNIRGPVV